jgi:hypothetical protein
MRCDNLKGDSVRGEATTPGFIEARALTDPAGTSDGMGVPGPR